MTGAPLALSAAIGAYPHTAALRSGAAASALLRLEFADVKPISRAFAPMVREARYDVCEMAIATFIQAKAHGKPLTLLPVAMAARFQESALLCQADGPIQSPADLKGRRVGVRAYSQTTGMWLRGILSEDFGVRADDIRWVTFEGAHVLECGDPPFVARVADGADLVAMLRSRELDAIIVGIDPPDDPAFRPVFADAEAAAARFRRRHGIKPVNHVVVMRDALAADRPDVARELVRMFAAAHDGARADLVGRAAIQPSLETAQRWCVEQGLTPAA